MLGKHLKRTQKRRPTDRSSGENLGLSGAALQAIIDGMAAKLHEAGPSDGGQNSSRSDGKPARETEGSLRPSAAVRDPLDGARQNWLATQIGVLWAIS